MLVKYFDHNGLKIIERTYDYKGATDGFNHLNAVDKVLEEHPNVPIPEIKFNPRQPRIIHSVPTHLRQKDDFDTFN